MNNKVQMIKAILEKDTPVERGMVGFNVNVDSILDELARKPINTDEEKALANALHNASFINRNQGSIDEKIQTTINLLNSAAKGVETQYSCSSHPRYYFNLPLSFTKEEENKFVDVLGVGSDSVTNEYMLGYPSEFYIRSLVDNTKLPEIMERVIKEGKTTKPAEELFKMPYVNFVDMMFEKAQGNQGSLLNFLYIGAETLDYLDGLNVRISPYDDNRSIVSIASDLVSPVLYKLEDADSVYWALIERLELKVLKVLGAI